MSRNDKSLERLVSSGRGVCDNVEEYVKQLRNMAEEDADIKKAKERGKVFKALGDITRQRIISLLSLREMCVCELIAALKMTQPTTSHHLKILEDANLISSRKDGKWVYYSLVNKTTILQMLTLVPS